MHNLLHDSSSSMRGSREPLFSLTPLSSLSSSVLCLTIIVNAAASQQKQEAAGSLRPSPAQSSAPTIGWSSENPSCPEPLLALHGRTPVPGEHLGVHHDRSGPGTTSDDPGSHPWSEPCGLGLGKAVRIQPLAGASFGAGRGADHVGVRTQESCHGCSACEGMELHTLSLLGVPLTFCYSGGAIIMMLLGSAVVIPLQLRLGRESGG